MHKLKILYFHSDRISLIGIPYAFHLLGHNVVDTEYRPRLKGIDEKDIDAVEREIRSSDMVDLVFTYDFIPSVSIACERSRIKYLAWVYDCPQVELFRTEVTNPYSFISVFDKNQYEYLNRLGSIKNLYHFPLAADIDLFSSASISPEEEDYYRADVAFLGRMYDKEYVSQIYNMCSQIEQEEIMNLLKNSICEWESNSLKGKAPDGLIEKLFSYYGSGTDPYQGITKRDFVESTFLAPKCNELERKVLLNSLANHFSLVLYSDKLQYEDVDPNIILRGPQDYISQMPKVFYMSKINLNITSKSIESGIPQRVWDILAVGGFCLTNYQPELEEYFEIGHDLVVYHSIPECVKLIDYYLSHEDERLKIALNGYKKVKKVGDIKARMRKVIDRIVTE